MGTLRALAVNSRLRTLDLSFNPLCERRAMRPQLIAMFPALEFFNGARLPRLRSKLVAPSPSPTPARVRTPRSRWRSNGGERRHSGGGDFAGETIGERATRLSREPATFELCVLALSADQIERPTRVYRIGAETTLRRPQLGREHGGGSAASEKESEGGYGGYSDPEVDSYREASGPQERAPSGGDYYEPELYVVLRYGDEQAQCDAPVVAFRTSQGKRKKLLACECAAPTAGSRGVAGIMAGVAETKHSLRRKALVSFPHYINRKTPLEIALWEKTPRTRGGDDPGSERPGRDRLWATASVRASQVPLYTQHSQTVDAAFVSLVALSADAPKGGRVASRGMLAAKQSVHVRLSVRRRHDTADDGGRDAMASGIGDDVGDEERRLRQNMRAKRKRAAAKAAAQSPAWKQHLPRGNIDVLHELTKTVDEDDAELSAASAEFDSEDETEEAVAWRREQQCHVANRERLEALAGHHRPVAKHAMEHLRTVVGFGSKFSPTVKKTKWTAKPIPPPPAAPLSPLARTADLLSGRYGGGPANVLAFDGAATAATLARAQPAGGDDASAALLGNTHHLLLRNRAVEWVEDLRHRSTTIQTALDVLLRMADSRHGNGKASVASSARLGGALARFGRQLRDFEILDQIEIPDVVLRSIEMDEAIVLSAGRAPYTALGAMVDDVVADVHAKQQLVARLQVALNDEASASVQDTSAKFDERTGLSWADAAVRVDEICAAIRAERAARAKARAAGEETSSALVVIPM